MVVTAPAVAVTVPVIMVAPTVLMRETVAVAVVVDVEMCRKEEQKGVAEDSTRTADRTWLTA